MAKFINIAHCPLPRLNFSTLINPPNQFHLPNARHDLADNREFIEANKQYIGRLFILNNQHMQADAVGRIYGWRKVQFHIQPINRQIGYTRG